MATKGIYMRMRVVVFLKTLVKSSLDSYVLPGTLTGTEILWLYLVQWQRELTKAMSASFFSASDEDASGTPDGDPSIQDEGNSLDLRSSPPV